MRGLDMRDVWRNGAREGKWKVSALLGWSSNMQTCTDAQSLYVCVSAQSSNPPRPFPLSFPFLSFPLRLPFWLFKQQLFPPLSASNFRSFLLSSFSSHLCLSPLYSNRAVSLHFQIRSCDRAHSPFILMEPSPSRSSDSSLDFDITVTSG